MKNHLHIYTRVSSSVQVEEGTSLDNQKNLGIKKSQELGIPYKIWNEGGQSSYHDDLENRPVLVELLSRIEDDEVQDLFVYNTDRLSRNQRTWGMIRYKLLEHAVTLHTPSGKMELKNPMDDLILGIMSEISQYDNKIRTERSRQGRFLKIQSGNWRGGPPPFGYRIEDKKLQIDDFESKWIQKMFDWYSNNIPTNDIRDNLNTSGVITRRGNSNWSLGSIQKIIGNTVYIGYYNYTDKSLGETVRVPTPPIVDQITFDKVQRVRELTLKRKQRQNPTKRFYLLRDLLVCGHCNSQMSGRIKESKNEYHYYCPKKERNWVKGEKNPKKWSRGHGCSMIRSLNIGKTDELVWNTVLETVRDSYHLKEEFRDKVLPVIIENRKEGSITSKKMKHKIKRIQKELSRIEATISNYETDVLLKRHSGNPKLIRNNLREEQHKIEQKLESSKQEFHLSQVENSWVDWLSLFKTDIEGKSNLSDEEKREYLLKVLDQVEVFYDQETKHHELKFSFRVPIVNDKIDYTNPERKSSGWTIEDGVDVLVRGGSLNNGPGRPKKNIGESV